MDLYIGNKKFRICFNGQICKINLLSVEVLLNGIQLLSKDGYILRDSNGLYLTAREGN